MTKAIKELIHAIEALFTLLECAAVQDEDYSAFQRLQTAVKKVRDEDETEIRTGYLVLVELADGRKRVTATVESGDKYLSRSGIASLGVEAEVTYSAEVNDLTQARESLKTILQQEQWAGHGMTWCDLSREDLIAAIRAVAENVNSVT